MLKPLLIYLITTLVCLTLSTMSANGKIDQTVTVCPSDSDSNTPPSFTASTCRQSSFYQANPQGRQIWIKTKLSLDQAQSLNQKPLGIFLAGKASSQLFLNGQLMAENGQPSLLKSNEKPGKMDFVAFVNPMLINANGNNNEILIKMSGHHGYLDLVAPLHNLSLGTYKEPSLSMLNHYWRSLIPLGILILGAVYFSLLGIQQKQTWPYFLLPALTLFSAGQLCAEVIRAFYPYAYPIHDLRLIGILVMAIGFGLSLLGYIINFLRLSSGKWVFLGVTALTLVSVYATKGFDLKSAIAIGLPSITCLIICCCGALKRQPHAAVLSVGFALFLGVLTAAPSDFLDVYFFYIVAALVFVIFIQQLKEFSEQEIRSVKEKARADKLQLIIDQHKRDDQQVTLPIKSSGSMRLLNVSTIKYCKGAGDYVELVLSDGSNVLHNETLADLEDSLPSQFLRVHRSYIVNTTYIDKVERQRNGVGTLTLVDGGSVPVSRRIMPSVRAQLGSAPH